MLNNQLHRNLLHILTKYNIEYRVCVHVYMKFGMYIDIIYIMAILLHCIYNSYLQTNFQIKILETIYKNLFGLNLTSI